MTGSRRFADPTLLDAMSEPWEYQTDGVTASSPDAWTLRIDVTLRGSDVRAPMYERPNGDREVSFTGYGESTG